MTNFKIYKYSPFLIDLDLNLKAQINFIKCIETWGIVLYSISHDKIKDIVSIDSDFDIYRTLKKQSLNNLLRQ